MIVVSNEDIAAESLLTLHVNNIEYYDKQDIVLNTESESIIPSTKNYFFHQRIIDFVNKI